MNQTQPIVFSIETAVREAWALFKKHFTFFLVVALISVILKVVSNADHLAKIILLIVGIASYIWGIVWIKISLAAARGEEHKLSFGSIQPMFPTFNEVVGLIAIAFVSYILVGIGFGMLIGGTFLALVSVGILAPLMIIGFVVLLIGLYIAFRLTLAVYIYIDTKTSVRDSLKMAWKMSAKPNLWSIARVLSAVAILYIIGAILFGVGLLITYPLASILMAKFYIALSAHVDTPRTVAEQPIEIAPTQ